MLLRDLNIEKDEREMCSNRICSEKYSEVF